MKYFRIKNQVKKIGGALIFMLTTLASAQERTALDLYCESMSLALYESMLIYQPPKTKEIEKRVEKAQLETLKACKAMPVVGVRELKERNMSPSEIVTVGCIGIAEGIFMAQSDSKENHFSIVELSKNRQFIANACTNDMKRFLNDLKNKGPKYTLQQKYPKIK